MKKIIFSPHIHIEEILFENVGVDNIVVGVTAGGIGEFVRIVMRTKIGFTLCDMFLGVHDDKWFSTAKELLNNYPDWNWYSFNNASEFAEAVLRYQWR